MGSEHRSQNFDLEKFQQIQFQETLVMSFFSWNLVSEFSKLLSRRPSSNSAQNFGQIPSRALGLIIFSELHLEEVAPSFEEIQGRQTERQQTLAYLPMSSTHTIL